MNERYQYSYYGLPILPLFLMLRMAFADSNAGNEVNAPAGPAGSPTGSSPAEQVQNGWTPTRQRGVSGLNGMVSTERTLSNVSSSV
jgi:hypothetical protein